MHNNRTTVVLHQELVLDVGYVGDGQVVAAFISTTAGLPPRGPTRHTCGLCTARTHARTRTPRTCTPTQVNPAWPTSGITSPADRGGARDR